MTIAPQVGRHDKNAGQTPDPEHERAPGNGKHYSIWTIGCQMNESESAQVGAALELAGFAAPPRFTRDRNRCQRTRASA